jgi:hypothetical protein
MNFNEKRFCGSSRTGESVRFQIAISRFESSRPSQPVTASEKLAVRMAERPTIGGLLRFGRPSPDSRVYRIPGQFTESLRPLPRIFPFSGDFHRRRGSITTGCRQRESISFASQAVKALDRKTHPQTARRGPSQVRHFLQFRSGRIGRRQSCAASPEPARPLVQSSPLAPRRPLHLGTQKHIRRLKFIGYPAAHGAITENLVATPDREPTSMLCRFPQRHDPKDGPSSAPPRLLGPSLSMPLPFGRAQAPPKASDV